jgi:DNA-binding IclR family transcriptional regulator
VPVTTRLPSPAYQEAKRVQRAALRLLRSGMRCQLKPRVLATLAGCSEQSAKNVLHTLKAQRLLAESPDGFALTDAAREGDAP